MGNRLTNNIGNTSPMGVAGMGGGKGRQGRAMRRQETERDGPKRNQPAIPVFCDAHQFANESPADIDKFSTPLDLSVGTHPSHLRQRRVLDITKLFRIWLKRGHIEIRRRDLSQGPMRAHRVIDRAEAVAPFLLSLGSACWRAHDLFLEGTVESFMPPVLLGMSGLA